MEKSSKSSQLEAALASGTKPRVVRPTAAARSIDLKFMYLANDYSKGLKAGVTRPVVRLLCSNYYHPGDDS